MSVSDKYSEIKKSGATFTPPQLAHFLAIRIASYLDNNRELKVCDPACGDGALLVAMADVLSKQNIAYSLSGSDTSVEYANKTIARLNDSFPLIKNEIEVKDFVSEKVGTLFNNANLCDIIIANPPYVRTQILGATKAQTLAKEFNLKGKVDLYFPFLINMTESLNEGGILGVITSNRYITTKSGASIREYLLEHFEALEIIDLGDTKLFDAAVLPAIFIGRKKSKKDKENKAVFRKIYMSMDLQQATELTSIYDVLNCDISGVYKVGEKLYDYSIGYFQPPTISSDIWQMTSNDEKEFIEIVTKNRAFFIEDKFKVRVGVKSCADEIFFHQDWGLDEIKPEKEFFRRIISQEDINRWKIREDLREVIYPHVEVNGGKEVLDIFTYPNACAFFNIHKERLESRTYLTKSKRNWYEYWVPQNPVMWKYPKVVFPDISVESRFSIDTTGAIVDGNCYWLVATTKEEEELLYLIVGVANSKTMESYHNLCFNNKLYSGRKRYLSQYVGKYPIPDPKSLYSKKIINIVREMYTQTIREEDIKSYEEEIDFLVEQAFGLRVK